MFDYVDELAFTNDQGARAQKLFAAVVLAALDDAIADDKKYGNGAEVIARWARSRDGREVLMCAGIDPNERTVKGMMEFVRRGVRTSVALSREESERQHARAEAAESEADGGLTTSRPDGDAPGRASRTGRRLSGRFRLERRSPKIIGCWSLWNQRLKEVVRVQPSGCTPWRSELLDVDDAGQGLERARRSAGSSGRARAGRSRPRRGGRGASG